MKKPTVVVVSQEHEAVVALSRGLEEYLVKHVANADEARGELANKDVKLVVYDELTGDADEFLLDARRQGVECAFLAPQSESESDAGLVEAELGDRLFRPVKPQQVRRLLERIGQVEAAERRRNESEARARAMERTTLQGMFTLNQAGEILASSPSAALMFGASLDSLGGTRLADLIAQPHRTQWEAAFSRLSRAEEGTPISDRREVYGRRHDDGGVFPIVVSTSAVIDGDLHRFVVIVHDRTRERQLERRLHQAQEQERRRIGHELHDSVGGQLTGVEIAGSLLHRKLKQEGSRHAAAAAELLEHLRELQARVRAVSRGLLPVDDDPLGLMTALQRMVKLNHGRGGTRCTFACDGEVTVADPGVATNLYYIAEEAVQNAIRHADANRVVVELERNDQGRIVLTVRDDGVGIPENAGAGDGIGMDSMTRRASLIGASLQINSVAPSGTRVRCELRDRGTARKES